MSSPGRARLGVLAAALLFSTGGAAIKAAGFTGWQVASLRSGIAAVAVLLLSRQARTGWTWRAVAVGLAYAATLVLFVLATRLTTSANAIFLQATAPLYLLALGPWILHERIDRRDLLVMAALAAGLACFFVGREPSYLTAPDPASGNLLAALSGLTWAITVVGLRWLGKHGGAPTAAIVSGNFAAFAAALPFAWPLGSHPIRDWLLVIYLGVFQIGLAYILVSAAVTVLPAFEVTLLLYLEPALNPVWAYLAHGERPGARALLGGTIILGTTAIKAVSAGRWRAQMES